MARGPKSTSKNRVNQNEDQNSIPHAPGPLRRLGAPDKTVNPSNIAKLKEACFSVLIGRHHLQEAVDDIYEDNLLAEEMDAWATLNRLVGMPETVSFETISSLFPSLFPSICVASGEEVILALLAEALVCYMNALYLCRVVEAETTYEERILGQGRDICQSMALHLQRLIGDFDFNGKEIT